LHTVCKKNRDTWKEGGRKNKINLDREEREDRAQKKRNVEGAEGIVKAAPSNFKNKVRPVGCIEGMLFLTKERGQRGQVTTKA